MINRYLLAKEIREQRWIWVLGLVILVVVAAVNAFLHEWLVDTALDASKQLSGVPRWVQRMLQGVDQLRNFEFATWANWNPKNLIQFGSLTAILLGITAFAGESENNTFSFLLTNGLSRLQVFATKIAAGIVVLFVVMILPTALIPVISHLAGKPLGHLRIIGASLVTFLGCLVIYALAVLIALYIRDRIKAGLGALLAVLGIWAIGLIPGLDWAGMFRYTSAAAYYFGVRGYPWGAVVMLVLLSVLIVGVTWRRFARMDL